MFVYKQIIGVWSYFLGQKVHILEQESIGFFDREEKKNNCYFAMNYINEFGKVENMGGDTNRLDIFFVEELCLKERA